VGTALSFEDSVFSLAIAAALCIGSLSYGTSVCGSRIKVAQIFLLNAGLLALIFALLRAALSNAWRFPIDFFGPWPHRIYRVWSLSERSAITLALIAAGLVTIEVAGRIGGDATRKRFQWSIIAAASVLVAINIIHFCDPFGAPTVSSLMDYHSHCSRRVVTAEVEDLYGLDSSLTPR